MKVQFAHSCLNCKKELSAILASGHRLLRNYESQFSICTSCVETASAKQEIEIQTKTKANKLTNTPDIDLPWPKDIYEAISKHVQGQEDTKKKLASAISRHLRCGITGKSERVLILGPSGTGKTECLRAVEAELDIPLVVQDSTELTTSGYVGSEVNSIIKKLASLCNYDVAKIHKGIIFIDEIDKKANKGTSSANPDIGTGMVQDALLKLTEGHKYEITTPDKANKITVDSSKIMFVFAGAFSGMQRKSVTRRTGLANNEAIVIKQDLTEGLIKYGMKAEFVRRMTGFCETHRINHKILSGIYSKKVNSIKDRFVNMMKLGYGIEVKIAKAYEESAIEEALNTEHPVATLERKFSEIQDEILFSSTSKSSAKKLVQINANGEIKIK